MNQLMAMLQKRILGIPAWGWALVIGGTIVGYAYLTRSSGDEGPDVAPTAPPYADDESPSDAGDVPGVPNPPPDQEPEITTNPAWVRYVTDRLVAEGLYGAVEVNNALTKVLGGLEVTEQEAAIYNLAVRRFGAPPEGAPPIVVIPRPPTNPPPSDPPPTNPPPSDPPPKPSPPPTYYSVRVAKYTTKNPPWNSTMWGIAKHYGYGSASNNYLPIWNDSKNAALKKKRGTPDKIQPGDIVYVKKK